MARNMERRQFLKASVASTLALAIRPTATFAIDRVQKLETTRLSAVPRRSRHFGRLDRQDGFPRSSAVRGHGFPLSACVVILQVNVQRDLVAGNFLALEYGGLDVPRSYRPTPTLALAPAIERTRTVPRR